MSNAFNSEMRPRPSKSGLETKTELENYNTSEKKTKQSAQPLLSLKAAVDKFC